MADDARKAFALKLIADNPAISDEDLQATLKVYDAQQAAKPAQTEHTGFVDRLLADNPALPPMLRVAQGALRLVKAHPVSAGAITGGLIAAPFTAGASVPVAMGAAGLGAAGGAGYGLLAQGATTGDYGTPTGNAKTIALEGAGAALGEGAGQGAAKLLTLGGKLVYKAALRPSMALQRDFGDIAATGLREGTAVGEGGAKATTAELGDLGQRTRAVLAAKDAERPAVAGYLPAPRGVPTGPAPIHPTGDLRGPGVLLRDNPDIAAPWNGVGAPGNMIAPREIVQRGLGAARSELSNRALATDALDELGALENRFLAQRNRPFSLTDAQAMKQAEQDLADSAYRAEQMGHPVNAVESQFHKGIAKGTRQAIEQRAPEVGPLNTRAQELIGLKLALEDATRRNVPGVGSIRTLLGDFAPYTASRLAIGADRVGASSLTPASFRTALIAALGGGS